MVRNIDHGHEVLVAALCKVRVTSSFFSFLKKYSLYNYMDMTMVVIKSDSPEAESLRDLNWLLIALVGKLSIHKTTTKRFKIVTNKYKMTPKRKKKQSQRNIFFQK